MQDRKPFQPPEESLHWISYNLKKLNENIATIIKLFAEFKASQQATQAAKSINTNDVPF